MTTPIWTPYSSDSVWNTPLRDIPNKRIADNSEQLVTQLATNQWDAGNHIQRTSFFADDPYSHPIYFADEDDPEYKIVFNKAWGTTVQGQYMKIPKGAIPERGTDKHISVVQPDGWEYNVYKTTSISNGAIVGDFGGKTHINTGGILAEAKATAIGYGLAAGNITGQELALGPISHALFMISTNTNGERLNGSWGLGNASATMGSRYYPAMGQRFFLDMPAKEIRETYDDTPYIRRLMMCLHRYGAIVGDTGGGLFKGESRLPYDLGGNIAPLFKVKADGKFTVPIPWDRFHALA